MISWKKQGTVFKNRCDKPVCLDKGHNINWKPSLKMFTSVLASCKLKGFLCPPSPFIPFRLRTMACTIYSKNKYLFLMFCLKHS